MSSGISTGSAFASGQAISNDIWYAEFITKSKRYGHPAIPPFNYDTLTWNHADMDLSVADVTPAGSPGNRPFASSKRHV